jgi:hypothetical protein
VVPCYAVLLEVSHYDVTKSEPDYSTLFSSIAAFPMLEEAPD